MVINMDKTSLGSKIKMIRQSCNLKKTLGIILALKLILY